MGRITLREMFLKQPDSARLTPKIATPSGKRDKYFNRRKDLCRNFILKTYSASETIWWIMKHITVNIGIILLLTCIYIITLFSIGFDPLLILSNPIFWIVFGVLCFLITVSFAFVYARRYIPKPPPPILNEIKQKNSIIIGFIGDIMPTGKYNTSFSQEVIDFFSDCNLIVGNLEGIMISNKTYEKIGRRITAQRHTYPIMNLLNSLGSASNWLLCVSNNHSGDFGIEGFVEMIRVLKGKGFKVFGNEDNPIYSHPNKTFTLNFVTGTMWSNYHRCRFVSRFECANRHHRDKMFNIFFPHWHYENEPYIRPFMGEKSRNFIRSGKYKRDKVIEKLKPIINPYNSGLNEWGFIFGHHSHTPQPIEVMEQKGIKKAIAYSGGNLTSGKNRKKHRSGTIVKITVGESLNNPKKIVVESLEWRSTYNN